MKRKFTLLIGLVFLYACGVYSQTYISDRSRMLPSAVFPHDTIEPNTRIIDGNVVFIHDGRTISVAANDRKLYLIRLLGIEVSEPQTEIGAKAKEYLTAFVGGMNVTVIVGKEDREGRYACNVFVNGDDVALDQLRYGMAWLVKNDVAEQSAEEKAIYTKMEQTARSERIGVWAKPAVTFSSPQTKPTYSKEANPSPKSSKDSKSSDQNRIYILGPRGGCYWVNDDGRKMYVKDKTLCSKE
ncbi:MAG: thermonuclease family protein [Blastocatellia bacterium]